MLSIIVKIEQIFILEFEKLFREKCENMLEKRSEVLLFKNSRCYCPPSAYNSIASSLAAHLWYPYSGERNKQCLRENKRMAPKRAAFRQQTSGEKSKGIAGGLLKQRSLKENEKENPDHDLNDEAHGSDVASAGQARTLSTSKTEKHTMEALGVEQAHTSATLFQKESANLKGIPLPVGLIPKPLAGTVERVMEQDNVDAFIAHKLAGLPGELTLDRGQTQKYFGTPR